MTVKELIYTHKMSKILDACCERLPDDVDAKKWRKGLKAYLKRLRSVEPIYSKGIILTRKIVDFDGEEYWDACAIQEFDQEALKKSYENVQKYRDNMDGAYALFNKDYDAWCEMFYTPMQYAMEFTPVAEILGHQISLRGIAEKDIYTAIAAVIDEITFFGFDEQIKQKKLQQIQETANEVEEKFELPPEQQEENFFTLVDIFPEMQIKEPTEEEKEATRKQLVDQCFNNIEYLYDMLYNIQWRVCETFYIEE